MQATSTSPRRYFNRYDSESLNLSKCNGYKLKFDVKKDTFGRK